ncbi:RidA family protein [Virgibacillus proomii]|uniref:RidA family protein n=1 Tax=Virgibacillus proomii TaxID=84407 RepID=UPI001C12877A|nr:RidA family protein [Virgibacillus proomii]MBU5266409.1 RidA family protein [Virgibacillus proomii]
MKVTRNPEGIHKPLAPYTHQIETSGNMKWLTLSGQLGMDVDGYVPEDSLEQLKLAFKNINNNLEEANMEVKDLTKLVFYIVGEMDANKRRDIISEFLGDHLPCTTMVFVVGLAAPQFKVEIDAWACKEDV